MRVLQIAPEISPGTGVGGVAFHLETEFQRAGVSAERLTFDDTHSGWFPTPSTGRTGRLVLLARVLWFTTVGTRVARRRLAEDPGLVAICHNDALAGDVYVNHGIVADAMRARGHMWLRMVRNPLHLFTTARDRHRYRGTTHRAVVSLTSHDAATLGRVYGRVRPRSVVIGNGVDTDRFTPATLERRAAARKRFDVPDDADCVVFVGHEYERKGLSLLLDAAAGRPGLHVLVVGGTPAMVAEARASADPRLGARLHLVGTLPDAREALDAADALALPSAYEANALVVLEALAAGLPVVATRVGAAPDLVVDGINGALVDRSVTGVAAGLATVLDLPRDGRAALRDAARATAAAHTWRDIAARYVTLLTELASQKGSA